MATVGEVAVALTAKTADFERGLKRSTDTLKKFEVDAKRIKAAFGEESAVGQFGKMLRGAGAIAGITVVGGAIANLTTQLRDLNAEFAKGESAGRSYSVQIMKLIPILKEGAIAGEALADIGNADMLAAAREWQEDMQGIVDRIDKKKRDKAAANASAEAVQRGLMEGIALAGLPEGAAAAERAIGAIPAEFRTDAQVNNLRKIGKLYDDFFARRKAQEDAVAENEKRLNAERENRIRKNVAAINELHGAAVRIFGETRTPVEKFFTRQKELVDLLGAGLISLDTFGRGMADAESDKREALKPKFEEFEKGRRAFDVMRAAKLIGEKDVVALEKKLMTKLGLTPEDIEGMTPDPATGGVFMRGEMGRATVALERAAFGGGFNSVEDKQLKVQQDILKELKRDNRGALILQ